MSIKKRNLFLSALFSPITCFLYTYYWIFQTKEEINERGGTIPTVSLCLIPVLYFILQRMLILSQVVINPHFSYTLNRLTPVTLLFPLFFWYRYITNFTTYILHRHSLFTRFKWLFLTGSVPVALSIAIPLLMGILILCIAHIQETLADIVFYLQELKPHQNVTSINIAYFVLGHWVFYSIILLILLIPQFVIQYYLNKGPHIHDSHQEKRA